MRIKDETLKILFECSIEGNTVFLPQIQLDRKTYLDVNKHLEHIGGTWNRKAKGHVFDSDPADRFENMLLTGETTDFKKKFQFFETPLELARKMVKMAEIENGDLILEPSSGLGAIAKEIDIKNMCVYNNKDNLLCNDSNPLFIKRLIKDYGFRAICGDFLLMTQTYNKIIQNPPFTKQQDIDHVLHAYSLLEEGGIIVSVVSESPFFRENKKSVDFREFLDDVNAEITVNPEGTFKASGTMVRTRIVKIVKY